MLIPTVLREERSGQHLTVQDSSEDSDAAPSRNRLVLLACMVVSLVAVGAGAWYLSTRFDPKAVRAEQHGRLDNVEAVTPSSPPGKAQGQTGQGDVLLEASIPAESEQAKAQDHVEDRRAVRTEERHENNAGLSTAMAPAETRGASPEASSTGTGKVKASGGKSVSTEAPKEMTAEQLYEKMSPAVVRVEVRDHEFKLIGQGSGFFASQDGLVVTNHHVIKGAYYATVTTTDGTQYFVEGIAADDETADLALLKVKAKELPFLALSEGGLPKIGTKVYAIGNPQGLTNTLSEGLISGHREVGQDELGDPILALQITAPISPGSSGGPLLLPSGKVAGVTTAYLVGGQNLNFAVPSARIVALIGMQGKLRTLASAGGGRLARNDAKKLDDAWNAYRQEDYAKALKLLTQLRGTQGGSAGYWRLVGFVHWGLSNDEIAISAFRQAARLDPQDGSYRVCAGLVYLHGGRNEQAAAEFRAAIEVQPDLARAYRYLGKAYRNLEKWEESDGAYRSAVALDPNDAESWYQIGLLHTRVDTRANPIAAFERAVSIWEQGTGLQVNCARAYSQLAVWYDIRGQRNLALSRCRGAVALWPKIIEMYPDYAEYHVRLGDAYRQLGRKQKARAAYESAIRADPRDYWGKAAAERLGRGRRRR